MSSRAAPPAPSLPGLPPGWAVSAAAEALGFDRQWPIHSARDWAAIDVLARQLAEKEPAH